MNYQKFKRRGMMPLLTERIREVSRVRVCGLIVKEGGRDRESELARALKEGSNRYLDLE